MMTTISNPGGLFFVILLPALVAVVMIREALKQKRAVDRRQLDLQMLGVRLGFDDFNPGCDANFAMGWGFLSRLSQGENRYAFNIFRGTYHDQKLFIFDYHYQIGSGNKREDHLGTMLMLIVKEVFPKVTIGPQNLSARLAAAFGVGGEIKFESAEFSQRFCVQSADRKFAYDVCSPQMMDYLLANRDLDVEIQGPVISIGFEPQLPTGNIEFNLQRLAEIRSLMPQYLFTNA
jgi:hypothetical protein